MATRTLSKAKFVAALFCLAPALLLDSVPAYSRGDEHSAKRPFSFLQQTPKESSEVLGTVERFAYARKLSQTGKYDRAFSEYAILMAGEPQNVDYIFGFAQALYWSGNTDGSLRYLARARELAPDYEDVWILELQILNARTDDTARVASKDLRAKALTRFPDVLWLSRSGPPATQKYSWELGANRVYLDNSSPTWQSFSAYVDRRTKNGDLIFLTASAYERFDLRDQEFGFGITLQLLQHWIATGAVSISSSPSFLAESTFNFGASRKFGDGWVSGIRGRSRHYTNDTINTVGLTIERYFGKYRLAYFVDRSRLQSEKTMTHAATINFYADSGSQFSITFATGDEVEIVAPGQLLRTNITTIALSGQHPINARVSVVWRLGTHRQGSLYRRNNFGVSLAGGF